METYEIRCDCNNLFFKIKNKTTLEIKCRGCKEFTYFDLSKIINFKNNKQKEN